ncbi:MAG: protein kinase, partial [Myxococcota bacterium]|nr:protein kinase [Myxococcota bacterium]
MREVFGPYQLLERIAAGGMAEIFKAQTSGADGFQKLLAIKRLHARLTQNPDFVEMLKAEARLAVGLSHSNLVQTFDLGQVEDHYCIAMEFIEGRDLHKTLHRLRAQNQLLPYDVALYIISEVCAGLDYAHRKHDQFGRFLGIIHRDISPQNILLSFEGEVKIVDFGIAKATAVQRETNTGFLKGKLCYMSPEQATGQSLDHRSDIFSTGILLYEILTGHPLYDGDDEQRLIEEIRRGQFIAPSTLRPDLPQPLEQLLYRTLDPDREARFPSAAHMQRAIEQVAQQLQISLTRGGLQQVMSVIFSDVISEKQRQEKQAYFDEFSADELSLIAEMELPAPQAHDWRVPSIEESSLLELDIDELELEELELSEVDFKRDESAAHDDQTAGPREAPLEVLDYDDPLGADEDATSAFDAPLFDELVPESVDPGRHTKTFPSDEPPSPQVAGRPYAPAAHKDRQVAAQSPALDSVQRQTASPVPSLSHASPVSTANQRSPAASLSQATPVDSLSRAASGAALNNAMSASGRSPSHEKPGQAQRSQEPDLFERIARGEHPPTPAAPATRSAPALIESTSHLKLKPEHYAEASQHRNPEERDVQDRGALHTNQGFSHMPSTQIFDEGNPNSLQTHFSHQHTRRARPTNKQLLLGGALIMVFCLSALSAALFGPKVKRSNSKEESIASVRANQAALLPAAPSIATGAATPTPLTNRAVLQPTLPPYPAAPLLP